MMAAGKVSKFAEGVPSLKLNLRRKFREKNKMKISHTKFPPPKIMPFASLLFYFPTSPSFHVTYEDGTSDYY